MPSRWRAIFFAKKACWLGNDKHFALRDARKIAIASVRCVIAEELRLS